MSADFSEELKVEREIAPAGVLWMAFPHSFGGGNW